MPRTFKRTKTNGAPPKKCYIPSAPLGLEDKYTLLDNLAVKPNRAFRRLIKATKAKG